MKSSWVETEKVRSTGAISYLFQSASRSYRTLCSSKELSITSTVNQRSTYLLRYAPLHFSPELFSLFKTHSKGRWLTFSCPARLKDPISHISEPTVDSSTWSITNEICFQLETHARHPVSQSGNSKPVGCCCCCFWTNSDQASKRTGGRTARIAEWNRSPVIVFVVLVIGNNRYSSSPSGKR